MEKYLSGNNTALHNMKDKDQNGKNTATYILEMQIKIMRYWAFFIHYWEKSKWATTVTTFPKSAFKRTSTTSVIHTHIFTQGND